MSTRTTIMIALVITLFLVIPGVSADYPWRNPNYHNPTPTELPLPSPVPTLIQSCQPEPEPTVQEIPSVNGVSQYHYKVMVLDGINQTQIRMALQYIPNLFSFEMIDDDPSQYEFMNGYPIPKTARLITIFNGTMHGYVHPKAMGYYYGEGRCTIVYLGQDPYPLSWTIQHECLHEALRGGPINQDKQPEFVDRWNTWMQERGIGFWSGSEPQIMAGWIRLQQDFLVSQCLTR